MLGQGEPLIIQPFGLERESKAVHHELEIGLEGCLVLIEHHLQILLHLFGIQFRWQARSKCKAICAR